MARTRCPFLVEDAEERRGAIRSPEESYAARLMRDLGHFTIDNFQDLYLTNCFTEAVNGPDQPLSSVELECGDGNYGLTLGGCNYRRDPAPADGNDRIAITGARHGFSAPIDPDGNLNCAMPRMARAINAVRAVEERDPVAFEFIPDYWMTEYHYPGSKVMADICANLETHRGHSAWEIMVRAMLLAGFRFGAINIQDNMVDPAVTRAIVVGGARYMGPHLQQKLANYLRDGGVCSSTGRCPASTWRAWRARSFLMLLA